MPTSTRCCGTDQGQQGGKGNKGGNKGRAGKQGQRGKIENNNIKETLKKEEKRGVAG